MGYNNTVAIVSNSDFVIQEIKNMLVLLRDIDKVECHDFFDAEENIKRTLPNVIILHSSDNIKNCLKLLRKIRRFDKTKDIPVLLYLEYPNADSVVEAFDLGITDILSAPLKDYELIIRVIWAIQKSEAALQDKIRNNFLSKLGIIDDKTGFYKKDFSLRYLETVIANSKEQKQKSCLIMIKAQSYIGSNADKERFMESLKKSVRLNDTVAMKDSTTFYVFLSRARMDGVYSVYERLVSNLKSSASISASVVEIQDDIFDDIINVLDFKLNKFSKKGELAVVTKQDFLDMWNRDEKKEEPHEELGIAKFFKRKNPNPVIQVEEQTILESPSLDSNIIEDKIEIEEKITSIEDEILNDPIFDDEREEKKEEIIKEDVKDHAQTGILNIPDELSAGIKKMIEEDSSSSLQAEKFKSKQNARTSVVEEEILTPEETREVDERNVILYKQSWAKKLSVVIEPLFKKYASKLQNEYKGLVADVDVTPYLCSLRFNKDDTKLDFELEYDNLKNVVAKINTAALGAEIDSETLNIEVMDFDYQKLDTILKTVTDEYRNYLTGA